MFKASFLFVGLNGCFFIFNKFLLSALVYLGLFMSGLLLINKVLLGCRIFRCLCNVGFQFVLLVLFTGVV